MKFHPDRQSEDKNAEEKFKEAKEAYEILTDAQKRAAYDQYGHAAFEQGGMGGGGFGGGGGGADFSDIFGDVLVTFWWWPASAACIPWFRSTLQHGSDTGRSCAWCNQRDPNPNAG